jgi:hypothetical protein
MHISKNDKVIGKKSCIILVNENTKSILEKSCSELGYSMFVDQNLGDVIPIPFGYIYHIGENIGENCTENCISFYINAYWSNFLTKGLKEVGLTLGKACAEDFKKQCAKNSEISAKISLEGFVSGIVDSLKKELKLTEQDHNEIASELRKFC